MPVEVAERLRRILALRSRLHSELGRDPTDEEMITAWADPLFTGGRMMGRPTKTTPARGRVSVALPLGQGWWGMGWVPAGEALACVGIECYQLDPHISRGMSPGRRRG